jgi:hypothetical protein
MCNNPNLKFVTIPNYHYSLLPEEIHPITEYELQAFSSKSFMILFKFRNLLR